MRIFILLAIFTILLAVANCNPTSQEEFTLFKDFKIKYNKVYKFEEEERMRFQIFRDNLQIVEEMNKHSKNKNFGITPFLDLTRSEFDHMYLMPKRPILDIQTEEVFENEMKSVELPVSWDWRVDGLINGTSCITKVKNQGSCGSCWAFSATEEIESMEFLQGFAKSSSPRELSEQQLVNCCPNAFGCSGGWTYWAYEYIIQAGGIDSEKSYPYTGTDGNCMFNKSDINAKVCEWAYVTKTKNETAIKQFIATKGPVSICVAASPWQYYNGGVLSGTACNCMDIDHCVQLVGYGVFNGTEAWIVRNSWGPYWGMNGYILLELGVNCDAMSNVATFVTTCEW